MKKLLQDFREILSMRLTKIILLLSLIGLTSSVCFVYALEFYAKNKTFQANIIVEEKIGEDTYRAKLQYDGFTFFKPREQIATFYSQQYLFKKEYQNQIKDIQHKDDAISFDFHSSTLNLQENIGIFTYKIKFKILNILNKFYCKKLFAFILLYFIVLFIFKRIKAFLIIQNINFYHTYTLTPSKQDRIFCFSIAILCFLLFAFTFWLGFPGYHLIGDVYNSIFTIKDNAHPVFVAYFIHFLYLIFGKNLYYLFLTNIAPFYLGLWFLICGFYLRFKSKWAILLIFPTFIGNIYFQNFVQYTNFGLSMLLFLAYNIAFFITLVPLSQKHFKRLFYFLLVVCFFALLWRHNAIFSVFPISFVLIYNFLQEKKLGIFLKLSSLSAILCLSIVILIPKILAFGISYPANHAFLHQIAGACVPSNDSTCFKQEWYYPHKTWEDVKELYAQYPLNADPFNVPWWYHELRPFKHQKLDGLQTQWVKSILKYPKNFINHELRFFKAMWIQEPTWIFNTQQIQTSDKKYLSYPLDLSSFPKNQWKITFSPLREKIYTFLFNHKILLNHFWGVCISFLVMCLSGVAFLLGKRTPILVFSFSVGFAGFWSAFFIAAFTTVPETRYMSPILPMAILALIGFISFVLEDKMQGEKRD